MGWWMPPKQWETEAQQVADAYPGATWRQVRVDGHTTRVWQVPIDPVPAQTEIQQVLHDLDAGYTVNFGLRGNIEHSEKDCGMSLIGHPLYLTNAFLPAQVYEVELTYPGTPGTPTVPNHPRARILSPEISLRTYPKHPHLFVDMGVNSWACALSPQSTSWSWERGGTLAYLDQVSIWILKSMVWKATGQEAVAHGNWIGPDTSHLPKDVLSTIGPDDPCRCGLSKTYRECHQLADLHELIFARR